jgi:formamidopyrimidine-DNA glycosylase
LASTLPGREVRSVKAHDPGILRNVSAQVLGRRLAGHRFGTPRRRGKWLMLPTDGPMLLVHSGMTGHPYYAETGADREKYERLVVSLDRGELRYADLRKLRGVWLAGDEDEVADVTGPLGPDALGLGLPAFRDVLSGRRRRLKPTLMDQSAIAGLGNLICDEMCWRAQVNPLRSISDLGSEDVGRLHNAMTGVLRTAVRHGRVPGLPRWLTGARDGPDPSCPRCGTRLAHARAGGRTTVWCPRCQPK